MRPDRPTTLLHALRGRAGAVAFLALAAVPASARDEMRLRVHDAIAVPGGRAAVVLRTYAPRPVGVGQICFRVPDASVGGGQTGAGPFAELESFQVFPAGEDVLSDVTVLDRPDGLEIMVEFESAAGAVNSSDGPLAVFFFRVADDVQVGQRFEISIDAPHTALFDPDGQPITIEPRAGDLQIRSPSAPFLAAFEGDEIEPGETAELELQTYEPFTISEARLVLRYRRGLAGGEPIVHVDARHGKRQVDIDTRSPGRVVVDLTSADASFNSVPGSIVRIALPTRPQARGSFPIKVVRRRSFLIDGEGQTLPVRFEKDRVVVRPD